MKEALRIIGIFGAALAAGGAFIIAGFPGFFIVCGAAIFLSACVDILKESK